MSFLKKLFSRYIWGNLLAMLVMVVLMALAVKYGLDLYTHHGQSVEVPEIVHHSYDEAEAMLDSLNLEIEVSDTGYVKALPPDCILEQSIAAGDIVKPGRVVYVKINSAHSPSYAIPDLVDNSSLRDAQTVLTSMGFKLGETEYIPGEKDWVYGIKYRGKNVKTGDMVSTEDVLIIQVGDGHRNLAEQVTVVEATTEDEADEDDELEKKTYKPRPKKVEKKAESHDAPAEKPVSQSTVPTPKE